MGGDLTRLRAQYPGWHIGTVWATAATGPDARRLYATRDGIRVCAWSAAELSSRITEEERQMGSADEEDDGDDDPRYGRPLGPCQPDSPEPRP